MAEARQAEAMRLDRFLWFARLAKTRSAAQAIAGRGHLRIDGRPVDRAHAAVRVGNVLAFPLHDRVRVLRVARLPARRGPPAEAATLYADLAPVDGAAGAGQGHPASSHVEPEVSE